MEFFYDKMEWLWYATGEIQSGAFLMSEIFRGSYGLSNWVDGIEILLVVTTKNRNFIFKHSRAIWGQFDGMIHWSDSRGSCHLPFDSVTYPNK